MVKSRIQKAGFRVTKATRTAVVVGAGVVASVLIATGIVRMIGDESDPLILVLVGLGIIALGVVFNVSVGDKR
jgi:hypothetical protein